MSTTPEVVDREQVRRLLFDERKSIAQVAEATGLSQVGVNKLYDQLAAESAARIKQRDDLIEHFAYNPEKWEAVPDKKYAAEQHGLTVPQFEGMINDKRDAINPKVVESEDVKVLDMPESVIPDSKLGRWCREYMLGRGRFCIAYAWLPLLAAAGLYIASTEEQLNLFIALVGDPNSGKTQGQEWANYLLGLDARGWAETQSFGSAEGMMEKIGDRKGAAHLWCPDEITHLMIKAGIKGSSFFTILNILFYKTRFNTTVGGRKPINFNAQLTISGGLVTDKFPKCFSEETEAGLYDRFLFALQPTGYKYAFKGKPKRFGPPLIEAPAQPFDGQNAAPIASNLLLKPPFVHGDVYEANEAISKSEGINTRVLELVTRCGQIVSAWDEKPELRASDMEPFWHLARYQQNLRTILKPGGGETFDAMCGNAIMRFLNRKPGEWMKRSELYRSTHIIETYGPNVCKYTLEGLKAANRVEMKENSANGKGGRPSVIVRSVI